MNAFESLVETVPTEASIELLTPDTEKTMLAQMISLGKSTADIAVELGRSVHWVRENKKSPEVKNLVNVIHTEAVEAARATIVNGTIKAASTLVDLMDNAPPAVRLSAAKDLLDRLGMKAPDKKQIETTVNYNMPKEERMDAIRARAARLGLVIDIGTGAREVEFVEVESE